MQLLERAVIYTSISYKNCFKFAGVFIAIWFIFYLIGIVTDYNHGLLGVCVSFTCMLCALCICSVSLFSLVKTDIKTDNEKMRLATQESIYNTFGGKENLQNTKEVLDDIGLSFDDLFHPSRLINNVNDSINDMYLSTQKELSSFSNW